MDALFEEFAMLPFDENEEAESLTIKEGRIKDELKDTSINSTVKQHTKDVIPKLLICL